MSRKKRHTYSAEFKLDTVMEGLQGKRALPRFVVSEGSKIRCTTNGGIFSLSEQRGSLPVQATRNNKKKQNKSQNWSAW